MGDDTLLGSAAADSILGVDGDDLINGGSGKDDLNGGLGLDSFVFLTGNTGATEALADTIQDFIQGEDLIDLGRIDAIASTAANDAFAFVGGGSLAGPAGQLRFVVSGSKTLVQFDTNGDGVADGMIKLSGVFTLTAADFVL